MTANPLKLVCSMATRELLFDLVKHYRDSTGRPVDCEAAGGVDVAKRVQSGEVVDVVVLAGSAIDALIAGGKLLTGSRVDLVRSAIAVAVRAGRDRPSIDSEAAVREAVLAAKTVSYSTGPSGVYLEKLFDRWGILDHIRARIVVPPPGVAVGSLVADGSVELGFQQSSELKNVSGLELLGRLPPSIQSITVFSGGIALAGGSPGAARELLAYLAAPAADRIKAMHGMDPV